MPWEKRKKIERVYPIQDSTWGISMPVNQARFTFESFQRLIKGLEKSKHYRTIVFDTIPSWMEEK